MTAAWIVARSLGIGPAGSLVAKGVLEEKATVLIAEFSSPDSMLARAATEAFTIDFSTSSVVRVADPAVVAGAMERMGLPAAAILTPELARELAERERIPALITGEITPVGGGFAVSARLISLRDDEVLDRQQQFAAGEGEFIERALPWPRSPHPISKPSGSIPPGRRSSAGKALRIGPRR